MKFSVASDTMYIRLVEFEFEKNPSVRNSTLLKRLVSNGVTDFQVDGARHTYFGW